MISSRGQLNDGEGEGALNLEIPTEYWRGRRRSSQDFRDLCRKFDGREEEGVEEDASVRSGTVLDCSFANVASTSPGPIMGRGHKENCSNSQRYPFQ